MAASTDHVGLSVGDLDRISAFYCRAFGMTTTGPRVLADGHSRVAVLTGTPGLCLELTQVPGSRPQEHTSVADGARTQGWFHWSLRIDNLDAALTTIRALGGNLVTEPADAQTRPGIRFAYVTDPEGNLIELTTTEETRTTAPVSPKRG
ncbi:VOC family protein [Streptomyces sp. NPDC059224]|uniref:VOC family protein n=1 Tax=Streptomyces sp. NPDC059224 TaxID=3346775 RepID=UPI00369357CC